MQHLQDNTQVAPPPQWLPARFDFGRASSAQEALGPHQTPPPANMSLHDEKNELETLTTQNERMIGVMG